MPASEPGGEGLAPGWALGPGGLCVPQSLPWAIPIAVSPGADRVELGRNLNTRESKPRGTILQRHMGERTRHRVQESGGPLWPWLWSHSVAWPCAHDISFLGLGFFVFSMTEADGSALSNIGRRLLADATN